MSNSKIIKRAVLGLALTGGTVFCLSFAPTLALETGGGITVDGLGLSSDIMNGGGEGGGDPPIVVQPSGNVVTLGRGFELDFVDNDGGGDGGGDGGDDGGIVVNTGPMNTVNPLGTNTLSTGGSGDNIGTSINPNVITNLDPTIVPGQPQTPGGDPVTDPAVPGSGDDGGSTDPSNTGPEFFEGPDGDVVLEPQQAVSFGIVGRRPDFQYNSPRLTFTPTDSYTTGQHGLGIGPGLQDNTVRYVPVGEF